MGRYLPNAVNSVLFTLYGLFGIGLALLLLDGFVSVGSFSPPSDSGMTSVPRGVDVGIGMIFLTMGALGLVVGYQLWKSKIAGIIVGLPLSLVGIAFAGFFVSVGRFYNNLYGPGLFLGLNVIMVGLSVGGWRKLRHSNEFRDTSKIDNVPVRNFTRLGVAIVIAAVVIAASLLSYTSLQTTVTDTTTATAPPTTLVNTSTLTSTSTATTALTTTTTTTSTVTSTYYTPYPLQLIVAMNATTIQPGQGISIHASVFNPLVQNFTVSTTSAAFNTVSSWDQYDYVCGLSPIGSVIGYAVFQGHYTPTNISLSSGPLTETPPAIFFCLAIQNLPSAVTFLPNSSELVYYSALTKQFQGPPVQATVNPNTGACGSINGTFGCFATTTLSGYWNATQPESTGFHEFSPGEYTVAIEDTWGQTAYAYFTVSQAPISTTTQATGLDYLSDLPGCAVSEGYISDPTPCFGQISTAVAFNCEAAAATSEGCNQQVNFAGTSNQSMNITVWYPYFNNGEGPSQNCKWTEYLPAPIGPQTAFAYCVPVNSTSFYVTIPAPVLA